MIMKKRVFGIILLGGLSSALLCGCKGEVDLSSYVSENRLYYYCAQTENAALSLKAYYTLREYPYSADGIPRDTEGVIEVTLTSAEYMRSVAISFNTCASEYGGDMSYDGAKGVYTYSVSAEADGAEIAFNITADGEEYTLTAENKNSGYLSGEEILAAVKKSKSEYIDSITSDGRLLGEVYLRFIYDEKGYYYVGITDRDGNTLSLLLDAATGEIIAERAT